MAMKVSKGVIPGAEGVPNFIRLNGPAEIQPIAFGPHGETDLQIILFGEEEKPESSVEFVICGTGQDFPNLAEFPELQGAANVGLHFIGVAARRNWPDDYFALWHIVHTSRIAIPGRAVPNGGPQPRVG